MRRGTKIVLILLKSYSSATCDFYIYISFKVLILLYKLRNFKVADESQMKKSRRSLLRLSGKNPAPGPMPNLLSPLYIKLFCFYYPTKLAKKVADQNCSSEESEASKITRSCIPPFFLSLIRSFESGIRDLSFFPNGILPKISLSLIPSLDNSWRYFW